MAARRNDKIKQYERAVIDYVMEDQGHFLVVSNDNTFNQVLRGTINKQLALAVDCVTVVIDESRLIKEINEILKRRKHFLVFLERQLNQKESAFLIKQLKNAFPKCKIITLTSETERQELVLLHEIGSDNIITKPVSINTLIEKIAFTVKPQSKLGQVIERGKSLLATGDFKGALKLSDKILELKPGSAAGLMLRGDALKGLGCREEALAAFEEASEGSQLYMEPLKKLAQFHQEDGDLEKYLEYLEKLDKLSPLNVDRKVDMGSAHVELGNEKTADRYFEHAVREATRQASSFIEEVSTRIATVYTKKNPEKAEEYFRRALDAKGADLDKNDIKTFNQLGITLRKQGKWREAIEIYERAAKLQPHDENLFYNMAMASAEGKDYEGACAFTERVLAINSDFYVKDPVIAYNIGLFFAKGGSQNGTRDKARFFLEHAVKKDPSFENPRRVLAALDKRA